MQTCKRIINLISLIQHTVIASITHNTHTQILLYNNYNHHNNYNQSINHHITQIHNTQLSSHLPTHFIHSRYSTFVETCFHHFFISIISSPITRHALCCISFYQVHVRLLILTHRLVSVAKAAVHSLFHLLIHRLPSVLDLLLL